MRAKELVLCLKSGIMQSLNIVLKCIKADFIYNMLREGISVEMVLGNKEYKW